MLFLSPFGTILVCTSAVVAAVLVYMEWCYGYWQRKGIFVPKYDFFFGHIRNILMQTESFGDLSKRLYQTTLQNDQPHCGLYYLLIPMYVPIDPHIIKNIVQVDFDHFTDRGVFCNETGEPLSGHLFALGGTKWHYMRRKLTPTFTPAKIRGMFDSVVTCTRQLLDIRCDAGPVNIQPILTGFTVDVICSLGFGIDCNAAGTNEIRDRAKQIFYRDDFGANLRAFFAYILPKVAVLFNVHSLKPSKSTFFTQMMRDIVAYREKDNVYRNDFLQLLLELKNRGSLYENESVVGEKGDPMVESPLSFDELAAQSFLFFVAGFDTSATTLTFALLELAAHADIQERLRKDINKAMTKHDGKLTYEAISNMPYMDKVYDEVLRKYPPLPLLHRECIKTYKVPETDLIIEQGTRLLIPIMGLHYDERFFPEPEKFDPERFSSENVAARPQFTYLPFGAGPRGCIGIRLASMLVKFGLSVLLSNYKFTLSSKNILPVVTDPRNFILLNKNGVWLDIKKI